MVEQKENLSKIAMPWTSRFSSPDANLITEPKLVASLLISSLRKNEEKVIKLIKWALECKCRKPLLKAINMTSIIGKSLEVNEILL